MMDRGGNVVHMGKRHRLYIERVIAILLVAFSVGVVGAQDSSEIPTLNNSNNVLSSTVPVVYGDTNFRERILQRTKGERDPIGLVLSGGSARAFAHIGVLRYIEEQGIVPDFIISNSMGSIVGILYAAGFSPEQIFSLSSQLDISQLFDLSWPLAGGFLDTSRFSSLVAAYLGEELKLEELPIPVMIVSEDLVTKRQVRIMEGDVLTVFDAAFALPVYFPPVEYRGHLLVDGGMTNLVPLEIAYEYTDTTIVSTTFYEGQDINLRNALSVLNISIDLGKRREGVAALQKHPDTIWIRCDVEDFSFMDFGAIEDLTERGYTSASLHEEALNGLDARGTTAEIRQFRSSFSSREEQVLRNYQLYKRVPQHSLSQQLFMGIRSFNYVDDQWYLRDDSIFGLMYNLRWKDLWLSLHGGMGWKTFSPMAVYPGVSAGISIQPIAPLLLEADFVVASDEDIVPSWYHNLGVQFRQSFFSNALETTIDLQWEHQLDSSFSLSSMLVHSGISIDWNSTNEPHTSVHAEGAWQLAGDWDRQFIHTKLSGIVPLPLDFRFHAGYTGRYALDGKGNVPIYIEDGFLTADALLLDQGSLASTVNSPANFLIVGRFGVDWQPRWFKPTAGELLIFHDSAIGLFGDLLWNEDASFIPEVAYGARFSTKVSLLGLNSLPTSLYVGYDGPSNGLMWGFMFGRRL